MPIRKLREFLQHHGVHYFEFTHSPAYTAQETAASAHVPGKELAKTVMVSIDDTMAMVVLPASHQLDFTLLRLASGKKEVQLANESDFADLFPECDIGAMPPFGNLYGMEVYAAEELEADDDIAFNAGSHTELMRLSYESYKKLVHPIIAKLSAHNS